jgi:signal transduction histidine kinase
MLFSRSTLFRNELGLVGLTPKQRKNRWQNIIGVLSEAAVWLIVVGALIGLRATPIGIFSDDSTLWLAGLVIAFALTYYLVIYRYFDAKQRHYIKDIADVIFIGILSTLAKDYSVYFFSLYILPIAGAAFALNILNSLLIATFASLFIAANLILNTQFFGAVNPIYLGTIQILFLILLTFFTRALAIQLRNEQTQNTELERKLKLADKKMDDIEAIEEEFVMTTTHQLNTPLSIIRGYSSILLDGDAGKLNAKQRRYAKEINDGSQRLANLIQDMLAIAHMDNGNGEGFKPLAVQDMLKESVSLLSERLIAREVKVETKFHEHQIHILANKPQLTQAINNLIDNSIKYSSPKSKIFLTADRVRGEDGYNAVITVKDQGIGIPKEEQSRIFQRFYRASNSKKVDTRGTGLGLYIVKRVIEEHDGKINFESKPGEGTKFTITIPVAHMHKRHARKA